MTNRIKLPPKRRKPPVRKQATPGHRNIAYLRVSTALQDADNQKLGIVEYTYAEGLQPVEFIEETTSGKTPISERKLQQVSMQHFQVAWSIFESQKQHLLLRTPPFVPSTAPLAFIR